MAEIARRDTKEKMSVSLDSLVETIVGLQTTIQNDMFNKSKAFQQNNITEVNTWDEFIETLDGKAGFIKCSLRWHYRN